MLIVLYILSMFFMELKSSLTFACTWGLLLFAIISQKNIVASIDLVLDEQKASKTIMGSGKTKNNIIDAVFALASSNTGALITIEKHLSLAQYSTRAIILNADVSREMLEQIFIVNTPLHDGAVIIRGDKIICAGAYFILSENKNFDSSTMGSRHRAALGISEVTDSLTVLVSEETGTIEVTLNGTMIKMYTREMLDEFLTSFME
jgi:diadenylate cyclase